MQMWQKVLHFPSQTSSLLGHFPKSERMIYIELCDTNSNQVFHIS